jgi:hypothetical protein
MIIEFGKKVNRPSGQIWPNTPRAWPSPPVKPAQAGPYHWRSIRAPRRSPRARWRVAARPLSATRPAKPGEAVSVSFLERRQMHWARICDLELTMETVRSGRRAARPRFINGEPARWSAAGGGKPHRLRIARWVRKG